MKKRPQFIIHIIIFFSIVLSSCNFTLSEPSPIPTIYSTLPAKATIPPTIESTSTEIVIQGTIRIWHSWDEEYLPALVQIRKDFYSKYPDVLFDVLYVPREDIQARYETEVRNGSGPTFLLGPGEWAPSLAASGLAKDISTLVNQELLSTLNQPALGTVRHSNSLIGIPYSIQGIVLYRNRDIVTINPNTFDELATLAQTSTLGEDIGAILEQGYFYSGAHLNGIGGQLMDERGLPAFNTQKGLEWLTLLKTFEGAGPTTYLSNDDLERFKTGTVGWIIDGTWNLNDIAETLGPEKTTIDPWPILQNGAMSGYVIAENLYLNPNVQEEELITAQQFIEYFISPAAQARLAEVGYIPANKSIDITLSAINPLIAQAMTALADGVTYPVIPEMAVYNIHMDIALRSFFNDGIPAEQVLINAEQAILADLAEQQETPTPSP